MKIAIAFSVLLLFFIVIGVHYKYKKESFLIMESPDTDINISIDPTVKETFLGMPVLHGSPYKISIFCFDEECLPEIHKIIVKAGGSDIHLDGEDIVITKGGLKTLATPVEFSYVFDDSESFVVSLISESVRSDLRWSFLHETSRGFSLLPLWVYFTH